MTPSTLIRSSYVEFIYIFVSILIKDGMDYST